MTSSTYWLEHAWLGGAHRGLSNGAVVMMAGGRFASVEVGIAVVPEGAVVLRGLTVPGFANAHSHAFHRALRGRTHGNGGTFWTWRDVMYSVAERLNPDTYFALARAVFGEMALAGISCVGEFHYLHHGPGGLPYSNANAMGEAVIAAAGEAGIRITLLDTLYRRGGLSPAGEPLTLSPLQERFCDASVDSWAERVASISSPAGGSQHALVGHAVHSVRGVGRDDLNAVGRLDLAGPMHAHVSEQVGENTACVAAYGESPLKVLASAGVVHDRFTAVHATHVTDADVAAFGGRNALCCMCPSTERDLADGIGRARDFANAGARLCLGSDSHAVIDIVEEARLMEYHERLERQNRGVFSADELLRAATVNGHESLGWFDAGAIASGARADLVTVGMGGVSMAGAGVHELDSALVFGSSARDITHVVVDGRVIVRDGRHVGFDVAAALHTSVTDLLDVQ